MSAVITTPQATFTTHNAQAPAFAFLAYPPPQKKRPTQPLPSPPAPKRAPCSPAHPRRRSATTSAIAAWVAAVQPGSPAPLTPRRRSSISSTRRSSYGSASIVSRRPSISTGTPHSASFLNCQVITPCVKDFQHDLTTVGYTSVFVHFPETPLSATIPLYTGAADKTRPPPSFSRIPSVLTSPSSPVRPAKSLKHFRSLSALKTGRRARSKSSAIRAPPSPAMKSPVRTTSSKAARAQASAAISASKKSKYAKFRPPPLATELALAQLADGGSIEDHIRRFAEAQAKADGATEMTRDGRLVGVSDVYRDGMGGVWRDQDEEWEYAHLLGGDDDWCGSEESWVRFGSPTTKPRKSSLVPSVSENDDPRRGSVSSQDSDLDPRYAMQAEDTRDDLAAFGSALAPACARRPGMSVLAIPARARRTAKHLRKPEFLLNAFPVPEGVVAPSVSVPMQAGKAPTPKQRRRPAPLKLTPPSPAFKCPTNPMDAEQVRDDFLAASFAPAPPPKSATYRRAEAPRAVAPLSPRPVQNAGAKKATMKLGMRGLFRVMGGKKGDL